MKVSELTLCLVHRVEKRGGTGSQPCGAPVVIQILLRRKTINFITCSCWIYRETASRVYFLVRKTHHSTFSWVFRNAWVKSPLIAQHSVTASVGYLCILTSVTSIFNHSFRAWVHMCTWRIIAPRERYLTDEKKRPICLWGNIYSDKECVCAHWGQVITNEKLHNEGKSGWSDTHTQTRAHTHTHTPKATWWLLWLISSSRSASLALGLDSLN